MEHKVTELKDSRVKLTIDLDSSDLAGFIEATEQAMIKQSTLEGFRPGKTPPDIFRKKVGEDHIRQEALNMAIENSLSNVVKKEKLDFISYSDLKVLENSKDLLKFEVLLSLFPNIKLGSYVDLKFKPETISVSDEEVDKVVQDITKSRTVFNEVDRPAQNGDRVEVDFIIKEGDAVIDGGKSENHPITIGDNKFVVGFEDHIVGMKKSEFKEFNLEIPADYYQQTIAGKTLHAEVTVKKIEDRETPELNDSFVASLGSFQTADDLRASIRDGLFKEKNDKAKEKIRLNLMEQVAQKSEADIPETLINERLDSMIASFDEELHRNGLELALYLVHIKKTEEELRKEWCKQAESQVKANLVLRAIARAENISVSEDEVDVELQALLQYSMVRLGQNPEQLKPETIERMKSQIRETLTTDKVFSLLEQGARAVEEIVS